jgi:hypothetical protein
MIDFVASGTRQNPGGCRIHVVFRALIGAPQKFFTGGQEKNGFWPDLTALSPELGSGIPISTLEL